MRITLLTVGSRGDVQPFVALGLGLQRAGHEVTLATGLGFEDLVEGSGLRYGRLRVDMQALARLQETRRVMGGNPLPLLRLVRSVVLPMMRRMLDDAWAVGRESEAIVYHPKALAGPHLAEKLGIAGVIGAPFAPITPTAAFPNPLLPSLPLPSGLNRLTYRALLPLMTAPYRRLINRWRREVLGLPAQPWLTDELQWSGRPVPTLYAFSPLVVPPPPDWPPTTVATGYWVLESSGYQPSSSLERFLAGGPPPVYVGFGSLAGQDPARTTRIVLAALQQAGCRGVLASGWGGLEAAVPGGAEVLVVDNVPHEWLFPRVAAVVHHGGAGTTAAGLRAGRPSVICPFFGDQPFWGERVQRLGVGPRPVPQKRLSVERLAAAIRQATTDAAMHERATKLGERLQAEEGVGRAVELIEGWTSHPS